ncbi:MAG: DUF2188 domain-containing protein [Bradyrhizobium sp.]|nr:DUF2188 domain-containing protein [Bradyrhizobium sp.]
MAIAAIHVVPDDSFDDWIVRCDIGDEFGHYPTREAAERVAEAIAQQRETELVVHLPDGRTMQEVREGVVRQIVPAMIGRNRPVPYYTLTPSMCE